MLRRKALSGLTLGATASSLNARFNPSKPPKELHSDIIIIGGGLGGCAGALSTLRSGLNVILSEETDWLGGQLTSQGVPPDEHKWIEKFGCKQKTL